MKNKLTLRVLAIFFAILIIGFSADIVNNARTAGSFAELYIKTWGLWIIISFLLAFEGYIVFKFWPPEKAANPFRCGNCNYWRASGTWAGLGTCQRAICFEENDITKLANFEIAIPTGDLVTGKNFGCLLYKSEVVPGFKNPPPPPRHTDKIQERIDAFTKP